MIMTLSVASIRKGEIPSIKIFCTITGENHQNNKDFTVNIDASYAIYGDIYYEIEYLTGSAKFTGWKASAGARDGVETYVGGNFKTDGSTYVSTITVVNKVVGEFQDNHFFQSDAAAFVGPENVTLPNTDLTEAFTIKLGQGDIGNAYLGTNGYYHIHGFLTKQLLLQQVRMPSIWKTMLHLLLPVLQVLLSEALYFLRVSPKATTLVLTATIVLN